MRKDPLTVVVPSLERRDFLKLAGLTLPSAAAILSGCAPAASEEEAAAIPVFTRLSWIKSAQWAALFVAQENGYYTDEGLDVVLFPGGAGIDPIPLVTSGSDHIGIQSSGIHLINARSTGIPIKCFAALYQKHPMGFLSLKEANINTIQDFVGKKIGVQADSIGNVTGVLRKNGIPIEEVEIMTVAFDPTQLLTGQIDIYTCWRTNQPYLIDKAGYEWNFISMWDVGGQFYAVTPFTTDKMLAEKPDVIEAFLRATLKGLQDTLDDPIKAVEITLKLGDPNLEQAHQEWLLSQANPLCVSEDTEAHGLGWMRKEVWESGRDSLLEMETITETFDIDELVDMGPLQKVHGS